MPFWYWIIDRASNHMDPFKKVDKWQSLNQKIMEKYS